MIRLFVALNIPEVIKKKIVEIRKEILPDEENYNWQDINKLHLTIKFIGDVPEEQVGNIIESISFMESYEKFESSLTDFGFFFKRKEPKILWAGLKIDERINQLVDDLNKNLSKFSIPVEERKFKAHLTLLRIKKLKHKDFITRFEEYKMPQINFTIDEASLYKSELLPGSSKYTEIKKFKLT